MCALGFKTLCRGRFLVSFHCISIFPSFTLANMRSFHFLLSTWLLATPVLSTPILEARAPCPITWDGRLKQNFALTDLDSKDLSPYHPDLIHGRGKSLKGIKYSFTNQIQKNGVNSSHFHASKDNTYVNLCPLDFRMLTLKN